MSLGTILLIFLIPILISVVPLRQRDQSCLYVEKVKRKRSWGVFLVNKRSLTVLMWSLVLLLTSCQQEGSVHIKESIGVVQAETELAQLGVNPFYGPELKSSDDFREMIKETLTDLKTGFEKAGAADLFEEFVKQAEQSDLREIDVNPGEKFQWMIFKKGAAVEIQREVVWIGKEPFAAFLVNIDEAGAWHTFVIAARSGNVFLAPPRLTPVKELAPNDAPFCEVAISPIFLVTGEDITVDASQSADPDGALMSMLVQVLDADNIVLSKNVLDKPPFIEKLTMTQSGEYLIRVSVTDDKGKESYSPGCPETKITVNSPGKKP